jgi:hypothetical protein
MNLKNISRDAYWYGAVNKTAISWSSAGGALYNSDGTTHEDKASVISSGASVASGKSAVGVNISPPTEETVPYRVKLYVPTNDDIFLIIGRNSGSLTGSDDTITNIQGLHVIGELDEIFMIDPISGNNDPLVFGIQTNNVAVYTCGLSVQKLDVSPPQFAVAVP